MSKKIVLCCDGTGNEYGPRNTNIVGMFEAIVRNDQQIAFYDPGVGTFDVFGRTVGKKLGILLGEAFGWGLQRNIEDAYRYLMDRFVPGDQVYLFGFSRGAFTVRALAGMLYKCGLLQKGSRNLIPYASKIYNVRENDEIAKGFKETYCHDCKPYFIGVWDTVGSLGYLYGKRFFNTRLNGTITYGYQAVSMDEKRKKFPVSLWDETREQAGQTIEQVWFAGVHSDVGGSYPERGLSDCALHWMLHKAQDAGLILKLGWEDRIHPQPTDPMAQHESRKGFWKLWNPTQRDIPPGALIHQSVFDRINANIGYRPANLPQEYTVVPWSKPPVLTRP
jgi:uncharacterized protein (DUF2235 family)